jgi:hypothetical protein
MYQAGYKEGYQAGFGDGRDLTDLLRVGRIVRDKLRFVAATTAGSILVALGLLLFMSRRF